MKQVLALALAGAALAGCGLFGGDDERPTTPTVGQRVPILSAENDVQVDPALAATPVALPAPVPVLVLAPPAFALASAAPVAVAATVGIDEGEGRVFRVLRPRPRPRRTRAAQAAPRARGGRRRPSRS